MRPFPLLAILLLLPLATPVHADPGGRDATPADPIEVGEGTASWTFPRAPRSP